MNRGEDGFASASGWDLETIQKATFLVAGAGSLGNEVLKNLVLLGAMRIIIVDFDHVEPHNLSRSVLFRPSHAERRISKVDAAADSLSELNPETQILTLKGDLATDLGLGLLMSVSIAFGCLDNRLARLYLNRLCWQAGVPWVEGGIMQLAGQVCTYVPGDSCYECQLADSEWRDIRFRMGCADVAQRYSHAGRLPTTPLSASIIGAVQVQEGLKLLHLPPDLRKGGQMFSYEGATLMAATYERRGLQAECLAHFEASQPVEAIQLGHDSTLKDLLDFCRVQLGLHSPKIHLRHEFLTAFGLPHTSEVTHLGVPKHELGRRVSDLLGVEEGQALMHVRGASFLELGLECAFCELPLWRLGIPFADIVEVRDGQERRLVCLSKDLDRLKTEGKRVQIPGPWRDWTDAALKESLGLA